MALEYAARSEFCLCGDCACERRGVSDSDTRQTLVVVSCVSLLYVLRSMHADALSHVRSRHIRLCRLWRSDLLLDRRGGKTFSRLNDTLHCPHTRDTHR